MRIILLISWLNYERAHKRIHQSNILRKELCLTESLCIAWLGLAASKPEALNFQNEVDTIDSRRVAIATF